MKCGALGGEPRLRGRISRVEPEEPRTLPLNVAWDVETRTSALLLDWLAGRDSERRLCNTRVAILGAGPREPALICFLGHLDYFFTCPETWKLCNRDQLLTIALTSSVPKPRYPERPHLGLEGRQLLNAQLVYVAADMLTVASALPGAVARVAIRQRRHLSHSSLRR